MSNAAILASLAWQAAYSLAAPTPNNTTATPVADPGWKKEPKGRGTFSILITSVLTLGLCVWTAIHPNVKPNASAWQRVKHRLLFVVIGMLAPEVVLAVAFYEWREAREFHWRWCKLYDIEPGSKEDTLRMKGAFFITMGGVSVAPAAAEIPKSFENILSPNAYLRLAQTKTGWQDDGIGIEAGKNEPQGTTASEQVVRDDREMIIKKEFVHWKDVEDKGKAEMLGKTLVCLQALWMLVQCVVRKASGLPVTLLEIHVAMHVICALGMYAFWFNKPQDVGQPLPLGISNDPAQLCLDIVHQARSDGYRNGLYVGIGGDKSNHNPKYYGDFDRDYSSVQLLPTTESVLFLSGGQVQMNDPDPARLVVPYRHLLDLGAVRIYNNMKSRHKHDHLMPREDLEIFRRAADAYKAGMRPKLPRVYLLHQVSTSDSRDILDDITVSNMFPAIFILLLYGACHAAAWNTHFPSPVECLLWRISSVVIAVIPAYTVFLCALYYRHHGRDALYRVFTLCIPELVWSVADFRLSESIALGLVLGYVIAFMLIIPVLCGRSYLFIESFLSLRSLPFGAFDSTPWEDYFPHF